MNDQTKPQSDVNRTYQVRIDKDLYQTFESHPTATELLALAKKLPTEHALYSKQPGEQPKRIAPDERVDLTQPGVERFVTLPLDQTEGLGAGRRDFSLPAEDMEWLELGGKRYELVTEAGVQRVVIYELSVPPGYNVAATSAHVKIEPGYPDVQIDMVWFHPALTLTSGRPISAVCDESFDGKSWQRWSRHRTGTNPWRPGLDNLATHFGLIEEWLARELRK
ncbi:MAG: hypothetical protein EKK47_06100 [Burkholderiales bacterium]|nr:MAG: hypothetical protein EKK47_06100 [Burkholderiales bacterium]